MLFLASKFVEFHLTFVLPFSIRFLALYNHAWMTPHSSSFSEYQIFWLELVILNKWWCFFAEFLWKCILRKQVEKGLAVILGIMSVAILLAEATLLPSIDLSLFSILIKSVGTEEVLVQVYRILEFWKSQHFKRN